MSASPGDVPLGVQMQCDENLDRRVGRKRMHESICLAARLRPLISVLLLVAAGYEKPGGAWHVSWDVSPDLHRIVYAVDGRVWLENPHTGPGRAARSRMDRIPSSLLERRQWRTPGQTERFG
jgi:hypothetical protein